jgi:hypothetical protein
MFWNRSPGAVLIQWRSAAAHGVECGEPPLFNLGPSDQALDGLLGLTALAWFARHETTIVAPRVLMGGASNLWLWAHLQLSNRWWEAEAPRPEIIPFESAQIVFSGVAPITHMTSLGVMSTPVSAPNADPVDRRAGLSRTYRWHFAPRTEPAAVAPWSVLPFTLQPAHAVQAHYLVGEPPRSRADREQPDPVTEGAPAQAHWLAWSVIVLVALMLLAALLG